MKLNWRLIPVVLLALAVWPEFPRYKAEWWLSEANVRLERSLGSALQAARLGKPGVDSESVRQAGFALELAEQARTRMPGDPRGPLAQAIALIMMGKGGDALSVLDAAIAAGERPEFTLNLGRARTTQGDETGASAAYLRTAWASSQALNTLPKAMREDLNRQVEALDLRLRAGALEAPPPLRASDSSK